MCDTPRKIFDFHESAVREGCSAANDQKYVAERDSSSSQQ